MFEYEKKFGNDVIDFRGLIALEINLDYFKTIFDVFLDEGKKYLKSFQMQ